MRKLFVCFLFISISTFLVSKDYNDLVKENLSSKTVITRAGMNDLTVKMPEFIFENTLTKIEIQFTNPMSPKLIENNYVLNITLNGLDFPVQFDQKGFGVLTHSFKSGENVELLFEDFSFKKEVNIISLWMIIAPMSIIALLLSLKILNKRAARKIEQQNARVVADKKSIPVQPLKAKAQTKKEEEPEEMTV